MAQYALAPPSKVGVKHVLLLGAVCLGAGWLVDPAGSPCLLQAVPYKFRTNLSINGVSTPFRLYAFSWASAQLLSELTAILAAEVLGYNSEHDFAHYDQASQDGYLATMGCTPPYNWSAGVPPCIPGALEDAPGHVALEVWLTYTDGPEAWKAAQPDLWPVNLGSVGYDGQEGIYIPRLTMDKIQAATGTDLSWYSSWKGTSRLPLLASPADLSAPMSCQEVRVRYGAAMGLADLENDGMTCLDGWWAWGLCANRTPRLANCTPIVYQIFSTISNLRLWRRYDMAGVVGFYDNDAWLALLKTGAVPVYSYTPSETSAYYDLVRIGFPQHNPADWEPPNKWPSTDQKVAPLAKLALRQLGSIAPDLHVFVAKLQVTSWQMTDMLKDFNTDGNITRTACNWLASHEDVWRPWMPDPSDCVLGQGVANPGDGRPPRCEFCPLGSFSNRSQHGLRCDACPPGRFQGWPGSSACRDCPPGQVAPEPGATTCAMCALGSFSSQAGGSACEPCANGLTTLLPGADRPQKCVCSAGSYGAGATCRRCPIGRTTASAGSDAEDDCMLEQWAIALAVSLVSSGLAMACVCAVGVLVSRRRLAKLLLLKARVSEARLRQGLAAASELAHPLVCISALNFIDSPHAELVHERLRDAGMLIFLDDMATAHTAKVSGMVLTLLSYQSLSWNRPGPNVTQRAAMRQAALNLSRYKGVALDRLYLWLDVVSVPQSNAGTKALAVHSLFLYASLMDAIIVAAPASRHEHTGAPADLSTYLGRAWCRVEQLAHICQRGEGSIWLQLTEGGDLERPPENWFESIWCVFDGELTCCRRRHPEGERCDKESLVPALLAMYFTVCSQLRGGSGNAQSHICEAIGPRKALMFPRSFKYATGPVQQERELFGDTIARVEEVVEQEMALGVCRSSRVVAPKFSGEPLQVKVPAAAPCDLARATEIRSL